MAPKDSAILNRSSTVSIAITSDAPGRPGGLDRAEPDRAEAEDRRALALGEGPGVDRVEAGPHHVAGEEGDVVGEPLGDPPEGEVRVRDEDQLRLGALERAEGLPVPEDARVVALVELAALAEEALAAGGAVGAEHPVPHRHPADLVAGGDHLADVLVADHEAGLDLDPAVVDVEVGAADAARLDPDDRVVRSEQLGVGDLVDPDLARRLEGDRSHGMEPMRGSDWPERKEQRWGSRSRGRC